MKLKDLPILDTLNGIFCYVSDCTPEPDNTRHVAYIVSKVGGEFVEYNAAARVDNLTTWKYAVPVSEVDGE